MRVAVREASHMQFVPPSLRYLGASADAGADV